MNIKVKLWRCAHYFNENPILSRLLEDYGDDLFEKLCTWLIQLMKGSLSFEFNLDVGILITSACLAVLVGMLFLQKFHPTANQSR
jgi:hypothetical protein